MAVNGFNASGQGQDQKQGQQSRFPEKQATPEQQQQFDKFFAMCKASLFSEEFLQPGAKILQGAPTIVDGMARIGASIGGRIYMKAAEQGEIIDSIAVIEAGRLVMSEVADFARMFGHEVSDEQVEDAYYMAADLMRQMLDDAGMLDHDMIDQELDSIKGVFSEEEILPFEERRIKGKAAMKEGMMKGIAS